LDANAQFLVAVHGLARKLARVRAIGLIGDVSLDFPAPLAWHLLPAS
jgi:hypothetical protein